MRAPDPRTATGPSPNARGPSHNSPFHNEDTAHHPARSNPHTARKTPRRAPQQEHAAPSASDAAAHTHAAPWRAALSERWRPSLPRVFRPGGENLRLRESRRAAARVAPAPPVVARGRVPGWRPGRVLTGLPAIPTIPTGVHAGHGCVRQSRLGASASINSSVVWRLWDISARRDARRACSSARWRM